MTGLRGQPIAACIYSQNLKGKAELSQKTENDAKPNITTHQQPINPITIGAGLQTDHVVCCSWRWIPGSVKTTLTNITALHPWADGLDTLVHLDFVKHENHVESDSVRWAQGYCLLGFRLEFMR